MKINVKGFLPETTCSGCGEDLEWEGYRGRLSWSSRCCDRAYRLTVTEVTFTEKSLPEDEGDCWSNELPAG